MSEIKHFPELKRLLKKAWDDKKRETSTHELSLRKAAEKMKIGSAATLHSWLKGERRPNPDNIEILASFFFPNDVQKQKEFKAGIEEAVKAKAVVPDPIEDLMLRRRPLRIGVVKYGHFGGETDRAFFNRLFDYFAAYASLGQVGKERLEIKSVNLTEAQKELCQTGEIDIVLGLLATPDRALSMKFFKLPLTIPLNALVKTNLLDKGFSKQEIRDALMKRGGDSVPRRVLKPIVNKMEVGGLHIQHFLHLESFTDVEYASDAYAERLIEMSADRKQNIQPVPIVIVDEPMCLLVKKCREEYGRRFFVR